MNKFLLRSLMAVSVIGLGHADDYYLFSSTVVAPGNTLRFENADSYGVMATVQVHGNDDDVGTLVAQKPVTVTGSNGILQLFGNATATFNDTLTIDNSGKLLLNPQSGVTKLPLVTVKGKLVYSGLITAIGTNGAEVSIKKKDGEQKALFDVSSLGLYSQISTSINGNDETFLEYYNATSDRSEVSYTAELASLSDLKDSEDAKKDDLVSRLRGKVSSYSNSDAIPLKNMKIQDYIVDAGTSSVTLDTTDKVRCVIENINTLIDTDATTKTAVEGKDGLSLIPADATGAFDFYTAFNVTKQNGVVPNIAGNIFVQWPSNVQLPLSNGTSNNTDFEFKTHLTSAEGCEHDLWLTNGVQDVETVKFSGDNTMFTNKVVMNGKIKNVEVASRRGYINTDFKNAISDDVSITILDGVSGSRGENYIKAVPVIRDDQKITFSTGQYNNVTFTSSDATEKVYKFDTFNTGQGSEVYIGDNDHKGITLVI